MAILTRFYPDDRSFRRSASKAECAFRVLTGDDGVEYLQLVSFGSSERQDVGTASQNIRMDEERAAELVDIILASFPGIERRLSSTSLARLAGGSE